MFLSFILTIGYAYSQTGTITDARDGKVYKIVVIGTQTWMAENLNVSKFRNGDLIPLVKNKRQWTKAGIEGRPVRFNYKDKIKRKSYGLYNWYAISDPRGFAPVGWHVPTDDEWFLLTDFLGGEDIAGRKMKTIYMNGNNESGFSALSEKCIDTEVMDNTETEQLNDDAGDFIFWWSSNKDKSSVQCPVLFSGSDKIYFWWHDLSEGLSVRCIKD